MTELPAPDLSIPPDPAEFERVLRLGLGRAVLYLQRHDSAPYWEIVLEAALNDWTWPADTVGTRERYVLDLIEASGEFEFYRRHILAAFPNALKNDEGVGRAVQFVRLLSLLARHGDQEAAVALRQAFEADPSAFPDASVFVDQDGLDGLMFVARLLGAALLRGEIDEDGDQIWPVERSAEEALGEDSIWMTLHDHAQGDPGIMAFAQIGLRRQQRSEKADRRLPSERVRDVGYDEMKRDLLDPPRGRRNSPGWRRLWGKHASSADIIRAACDFTALSSEEPALICRYLELFNDRAFPLDPSYLIHLVRRGSTHDLPPSGWVREWEWDDRLAWQAALALENVVHPAVRGLGLEMLERSRWTGRGADLLVKNTLDGDLSRIVAAFLREPDIHQRHGIGIAIKDLSKERQPPGITRALGVVYEYGPCCCCRGGVVDRLRALGELPDWMAAECRHDADEDARPTS